MWPFMSLSYYLKGWILRLCISSFSRNFSFTAGEVFKLKVRWDWLLLVILQWESWCGEIWKICSLSREWRRKQLVQDGKLRGRESLLFRDWWKWKGIVLLIGKVVGERPRGFSESFQAAFAKIIPPKSQRSSRALFRKKRLTAPCSW